MPTDLATDHVAADMQRIFGPLEARALVPAFHHDGGPRRGRIGRGLRNLALVAFAAVLLVTAALAIGLGRADRPAARTAETAAAPIPSDLTRSSAVPSFVPPPTQAATALAEPTSPVDVAALRTVDGPPAEYLAALRAPRSVEPPAPASPTRPVAAIPPSSPAPRPLPAEPFAVVRPVRAAPPPFTPPSAAPRCAPGSTDDRCIYRDVLAADARLRSAYDAARRAGVASSLLATANTYWDRALEHAEDDPDATIRTYRDLADALDEERRQVR